MSGPHYIVDSTARNGQGECVIKVLRRGSGSRTYSAWLTVPGLTLWQAEDKAMEIAAALNEMERRRARDRRERARRKREAGR